MFITASTNSQVYDHILKDKFYEDMLKKFVKNKQDRQELKQYVWISICQMNEEKLIAIWNKRQFKYYYVNIVKNQVQSSDSYYHRLYRKFKKMDIGEEKKHEKDIEARQAKFRETEDFVLFSDSEKNIEEQIIEQETKQENQIKLNLIEKALIKMVKDEPLLFVQAELFKLYYKQNMTYREIEEKTKIPRTSVFQYVNLAKFHIKQYINKQNKK